MKKALLGAVAAATLLAGCSEQVEPPAGGSASPVPDHDAFTAPPREDAHDTAEETHPPGESDAAGTTPPAATEAPTPTDTTGATESPDTTGTTQSPDTTGETGLP